MISRPINLARIWRSTGSPILVGKINGVLELERHEDGACGRQTIDFCGVPIFSIEKNVGAPKSAAYALL